VLVRVQEPRERLASCARRSPGSSSEDAGSIPATSTPEKHYVGASGVVFFVVTTPLRPPAEGRVTVAGLGAWLLKGNADRVDLAERFQRDPRVQSWCVQPGYRARMMTAGQRVVFWASGSRGRLPYGVWGCGFVTGSVELDTEDGRWRVPLDLRIDPPTEWVPRQELRADPRLADAEVFRQPQGSNPSYLSVAQFAALREYLAA
jgi:hypothetical protein